MLGSHQNPFISHELISQIPLFRNYGKKTFMPIKIKRSRRLRVEIDPEKRECLTSQAVRGIWIVGWTGFRMWDIRRRWDVGGQNSGCETSGEGGTSVGQNSGCETSGEGGMSADRIPDVRHSEKVGCRRTGFQMRDIQRRWNVDWIEFLMWDIWRRVGHRPDRIPDVRHPEKVGCRRTGFRMWDIWRRWWNVGRIEFRMWDIRRRLGR